MVPVLRSFFRYAALHEPKQAGLIQRVLAMPNKRFDRRPIDFLVRPEINALLAAPDRNTWAGRRDHALLLVAVETGLRCSELAGLQIESLVLERERMHSAKSSPDRCSVTLACRQGPLTSTNCRGVSSKHTT